MLVGCSTMATHFEPGANLARLKHIYVQQNLNDNHGLDAMIVRDLQAGASRPRAGPDAHAQDVKIYLTYEDQWDWDLKDYLISLGITAHDATTDRLLANTATSADRVHENAGVHDSCRAEPAPRSIRQTHACSPERMKSSKEKDREQDQD